MRGTLILLINPSAACRVAKRHVRDKAVPYLADVFEPLPGHSIRRAAGAIFPAKLIYGSKAEVIRNRPMISRATPIINKTGCAERLGETDLEDPVREPGNG